MWLHHSIPTAARLVGRMLHMLVSPTPLASASATRAQVPDNTIPDPHRNGGTLFLENAWQPLLIRLLLVVAFSLHTALATAATVTLSSPALVIAFNDRGGPELLIAHPSGEALAVRADLPVFTVTDRDPQGMQTTIPLCDIRLDGPDRLIARSADGLRQVEFAISRGVRHCAWRIAALTGIATDRATLRMAFHDIGGANRLRAIDLDWMSEVRSNDRWFEYSWDHLGHPVAPGNLGGVALYVAADDADEDEALLHIWVDEQLPHPRIVGSWTLDRARAWLQAWQRRYADRSQLILEGKDLAELRAALPFAQRMQANEIYLYTQTWRSDDFWPGRNGHVHINRAVFPRGEEDLRAFSDEVAAKGMLLKLHYVSGGIGMNDAVRIGTRPDRRLASWVKGTVAQAVGADERTIAFRPSSPVPMVPGDGQKLGRPRDLPHFFAYNVVRLDDELVEVGSFEKSDSDSWLLTGCRRGACGTVMAAHAVGGDGAGLIVPYGQNFVPDNDSTLLEEMAREFAGLVERCRIANTEFDGAEIHCYDGNWGYRKFATLVYQNIPQPVAAHDSSGNAPRCNFEYRFNATRRLLRGSCPFTTGGWNAPVQLDSPARAATRMLDAHFFLSQGHYGGAQGLSRPEPMFSVSATSLGQFGLTERMLQAVTDWKAVSRLMSDEQHARLQATLTAPAAGLPDRSHHLVSPLVQVARATADGYAIVPVRVLTRIAGDIPWQLGQEHGPLGPRQFVKAGEPVELVNPDRPQVPGFIIRVLWAFAPDGSPVAVPGDGAAPAQRLASDTFTAGNDQKSAKPAGVPANLLMMPAAQQEVHHRGSSVVSRDGDRLRVVTDHAGEQGQWDPDALPSWNCRLDMTGRRGVGLEIDGDGSGATLLVQIRGNGMRDYIIPIDFTGRRWVEIPSGEIAWYQACWGWRMDTKHCDYATMGEVRLGFGYVPPHSLATVTVGRLQALAEIPVILTDPVVTIGTQRMVLKGTVESGEYLEYQGGDTVAVCDANWNRLRFLALAGPHIQVPTGPVTVMLEASSSGPKPWLEMQFTTEGDAMVVSGH
jgi:hypothetical protein